MTALAQCPVMGSMGYACLLTARIPGVSSCYYFLALSTSSVGTLFAQP